MLYDTIAIIVSLITLELVSRCLECSSGRLMIIKLYIGNSTVTKIENMFRLFESMQNMEDSSKTFATAVVTSAEELLKKQRNPYTRR